MTLVGVNVQVRPVEGVLVSVRATVPVKPPVAVTVIVDVAAVPTFTVALEGDAANLNPGWTAERV
jgi:hypothetical protein